MSEDDRWSEVVDQVLEALDDADLADTSTRDALAEGVRQALESLESGVGLDVQILGEGFPSQPSQPVAVELVEGGLSQQEPRSDRQGPELRIADTDEGNPEPPDSPSMFTHVKVVRGNTSTQRIRPLPGLSDVGWIHIAGGESPETSWQTIYKGQTARLYRVACSQGVLDVSADGEIVERLIPGQSIDIEATLIRVTTSETSESIGGYSPLSPQGATEE